MEPAACCYTVPVLRQQWQRVSRAAIDAQQQVHCVMAPFYWTLQKQQLVPAQGFHRLLLTLLLCMLHACAITGPL
jgi:hypothetical protein